MWMKQIKLVLTLDVSSAGPFLRLEVYYLKETEAVLTYVLT